MKTLYEKLTPEQLEKLNNSRKEYPALTERAETVLKTNINAFEISISNALTINDILIGGFFDVTKFYTLLQK